MPTVRIYDDEKRLAGRWVDALKATNASVSAQLDVGAVSDAQFGEDLDALVKRRQSWRAHGHLGSHQVSLDDVDVFVVDFDLLDAANLSFGTGEQVAYLVRCFSECRYIIGMNLPDCATNGFDLTLLGHLDSYADLNIGSDQLDRPGLWGTNSDGFRPWHWPIVPLYLRDLEQRIEDVRNSLDDPMWHVLGIKEQFFITLPRAVGEFLGKAPEEVTFRDFVLDSGNALLPKDVRKERDSDPYVLARIGAVRVAKWIERRLLPGQDILVDAPHLVSRFPSLLLGSQDLIDDWNATTRIDDKKASAIDGRLIDGFRLPRYHWFSRPVWFWDDVRACEDIADVRDTWAVRFPEWRFCEDASRFHTETHEFRAAVDSPYSLRYLRQFDGVEYRPSTRMLA